MFQSMKDAAVYPALVILPEYMENMSSSQGNPANSPLIDNFILKCKQSSFSNQT